MNLRQATYIMAVIETGSISEAARKLYITQPSLSQMLRSLEKELGVELFDRRNYPLRLTYAGERYAAFAEKILSLNRNFLNEIGDIHNESSGKLVVGTALQRGIYTLPKVIPPFLKLHPSYTFEILEANGAELLDMVERGKADLAFTQFHPERSSLRFITLIEEQMVLVCRRDAEVAVDASERIRGGAMTSMDFLENIPWVLLKKGHGIRVITERIFHEYRLRPRVLLETHSTEVALRMTAFGTCVTIVPELYLYHFCSDRKNPELSCFVVGEKFSRTLALAYEKNLYLSRAHQDFIDITRDAFSRRFQ